MRSYRSRLLMQRLRGHAKEDVFGQQRNRCEAFAGCILNGIEDRRGWPIMRKFTDALGSIGSVVKGNLFKDHVNRWNIGCGGHDVVGHLVVVHVTVLK